MPPHDDFAALERLYRPLSDGRFEPNADLFVDDDRIVVTVELAGADPDSLAVHADARSLVVSGRRVGVDRERRSASIVRKEIQDGEFFKRLRLPLAVDEGRAAAEYRDGLLRIELPIAANEHRTVVRAEVRMTVRRTHA